MSQTEKQSIEALAVNLLMEIEQHTTLCIGDFERNKFLQDVNAGYNAALESYDAQKMDERVTKKFDAILEKFEEKFGVRMDG